jgi:hypothetical protein
MSGRALAVWVEGRRKGRTARPGPTVKKQEQGLMNWRTIQVGCASERGKKIKKGGHGGGKW